MKAFEKLLQENRQWALEKQISEPDFFTRLAQGQTPEFLWIGCSDSRVPAEIIVNAQPGEIFIHRNIANQVIATDFNCLSVLQYAVAVLEVKHIIVCGHYNCGGVKAALDKQNPNLLITNKWLMHIKNTYRLHWEEIDSFQDETKRLNRLVELNVLEQVQTLSHTSIVQYAWHHRQSPTIHGCVYDLHDGLLKPLMMLKPGSEIDPLFKYDFE